MTVVKNLLSKVASLTHITTFNLFELTFMIIFVLEITCFTPYALISLWVPILSSSTSPAGHCCIAWQNRVAVVTNHRVFSPDGSFMSRVCFDVAI